ncbi:MAG: hypothetical protein ACLTL6_07805 [Holdemanella porci]
MKYQELMKEVEGVGKLKLSEQENFYRDVLNESSNDLEVVVAATFIWVWLIIMKEILIRQKRLLNRSFYSIKVCHL